MNPAQPASIFLSYTRSSTLRKGVYYDRRRHVHASTGFPPARCKGEAGRTKNRRHSTITCVFQSEIVCFRASKPCNSPFFGQRPSLGVDCRGLHFPCLNRSLNLRRGSNYNATCSTESPFAPGRVFKTWSEWIPRPIRSG